jgi:hypothetical protein
MPVRDLLSAASTQGALPSDPNFEYNTLLLNGDGTNGAQNNTFLDSSTNNFTITRNGNTTQGSFSPYGTLWSNYFNGSSYLTAPNASWMNFGTSDFTIESWVYFNSVSSAQMIVTSNYNAGTGGGGWAFIYRGDISSLSLSVNSNVTYTRSWSPNPNTWYNVSVSRSGTNLRLFVDGTQLGATFTSSDNVSNSSTLVVANNIAGAPALYLNGYLSNLRINTSALYTTTYTPSTTPLTAISGTQLLTCQSNRFIDNSSNNYTLTINGTPLVQRFSPFNPSAPYSTSVIGGSGYFDGSGDYLSLASTSIDNFGTGDFTVEAWIYVTTASTSNPVVIDQTTSQFAFGISPTNYLYYGLSDVSDILASSTISALLNTWNHIAISRTSGTSSLYLNGTRVATGADITAWTSGGLWVGRRPSGASFNGYISNTRIVKGTGLYSGTTITVPTAPLTAITNTSLLTNFTNAGIPDLAMQNNLETVGSAQVSTSTKKYGTGSISFNGSNSYLISPLVASNTIGTGAFTIECWVYFSSFNSYNSIFDMRNGNGAYPCITVSNAGNVLWYINNSTQIDSGSGAVSTGSWYHIAVCRSGTSTKLFINGTQAGSTYSDSTNYLNSNVHVGAGDSNNPPAGNYVNGYIDDLRLSIGLARYTANFTPPTAALPTY